MEEEQYTEIDIVCNHCKTFLNEENSKGYVLTKVLYTIETMHKLVKHFDLCDKCIKLIEVKK